MDDGEPSTGSSCSSGGGNWTNEKHMNFLNSMEATFVRTMLIENNNSSSLHRRHHLRLDRYLPDSLESTLDSAESRRQKSSPIGAAASSDSSVGSRSIMGSGVERKRSRRLAMSSSQTRTQNIQTSNSPSNDQVVPQLDKRSGDKDERDPRRAC
ncbi:unnamed protein product [Linum tenue]|uniref:Uncharacterized protein n=1 Tax=Linum tenue TaxID=586396 RepID=A0AAV0QNZ0_9ROSI|nr:unnamed protein product [Linum tenue]